MWLAAVLACLQPLLPSPAAAQDPQYSLSVRPSICVSYNSDEPCTMSVEAEWQGNAPADICLREGQIVAPLHCWKDSASGSVELEYSSSVDGLYQLIEEASPGVLAETEIKVINRDLRSSRKRRRHVWSIL